MKRLFEHSLHLLGVALLLLPTAVIAQSADADLAQKLTNPIASLISIPVQFNADLDIGPEDQGEKYTTNIQPVIPFDVGENWNLITRTIFPLVSQKDIAPGSGSQSGLGDVNLSLFFSPKQPTSGGLIWGVGPVFLLPTASNSKIGAEKWATGPAVIVLALRGAWTVGMLANHVWSFAGEDSRSDISSTLFQPFASYTWPSAWTVSVQSESTYNWKTEKSSVPVNVSVAKLVWLGKLPVSLMAGMGYWAESPETGPEGLRWRLQANIVLPR